MGTIADKLKAIYNSKKAIKAAIITKGVDCDDLLSAYAERIRQIHPVPYDTVNLTVTTNQSSNDDIIGKVISVTYGTTTDSYTIDGEVVAIKIPQYAKASVIMPSIDGYKTPTVADINAVGGNTINISVIYEAELVSVMLSKSDSTSVTGVKVTINDTTYTFKTTAISVKIPFGTEYTIRVAGLKGYSTPKSVTYTASQITRDVTMEYEYVYYGAYILTKDGATTKADDWDPVNNNNISGILVRSSAAVFVINPTSWNNDHWTRYDKTLIAGVTTTTSSSTAITDFNGMANTEAIIAALGSSYGTSLAQHSYNSMSYDGKNRCYLGAAGEIYLIYSNYDEIEKCADAINATISFTINTQYGTSTQYDAEYAWYIYMRPEINKIYKTISYLWGLKLMKYVG